MSRSAEPPTNQERFEALVTAAHPCVAVATHEEAYALEIVKATAARTGHRVFAWSVTNGFGDALFDDADPVSGTEHPAAALYHMAHEVDDRTLCVMLDLAAHLEDARTLRALRDVIAAFHDNEASLVMIDASETLPDAIAADVSRFELALPTERQLRRIVRDTLKRLHRRNAIKAEISRTQLDAVVRNLRGLSRTPIEQIITDCVAQDLVFDADDVDHILALKRQRLRRDGVLEFVDAPVDLSEIGGLRRLKAWLAERRGSLDVKAREFGLPAPRGILLLGVQGAGKSLCAKAVAAAWQRPLLRLDPGALYDRYVGESERRLRSTLRQAEAMAPIILWIDEIEKGFASAASQSTDGGLSQRMFGTLLTWMQDHRSPVFIFATANNIEALPPELLRKGRFDEIFFVDLPAREVRREIFHIHLAKRGRDPDDFDLDVLADASHGFSGAEIEQAIISSLHAAFSRSAKVDTLAIHRALEGSPPLSVTMAEKVKMLRAGRHERCVPAD